MHTLARTSAPRLLLTGALGLVLALGGCSDEPTEAPVPSTRAADIAADKVSPPQPVVPPTWPLTGVAAADVVNRPALAVKIENPPEVRPQTGLDQADVVWEQVVEGGVTRFVAVYHSVVPDEVGPIRSVRPMDPAIAAPLHGVMAFSGGQPGFVRALADAGLQIVSHDEGDPGFYRTRGRAAPHNVFGTPATFLSQADAGHQASPGEQFRIARRPELATAAASGTPAGTVALTMSRSSQPSWTWDAATATWLRSESGTPANAASGARLAATNVVVLRVDLIDSGTTDPAGSPVPETRLTGTGEALVATGGRTVAATWSKDDLATPLALVGADGQPVQLAPGKTWVELVPNGTGSVTLG
ncbi:DUF3048 domain-containing protein [Cellulomonas aerilata]|uniref:DUF3048 domain-containing protein n=1 Tax=Cellulomonas aerilata TaxID=515326 RepID=UPI0011BE150C|nr:DUF3048 domain-containing protein [Cellulomonas aerilata]